MNFQYVAIESEKYFSLKEFSSIILNIHTLNLIFKIRNQKP